MMEWNDDNYHCEYKNPRTNVCEKGYVWSLAMYDYKNCKYAESIIDIFSYHA